MKSLPTGHTTSMRNKKDVIGVRRDMKEASGVDGALDEVSVIRLLMAYFGEKEDSLFLLRDVRNVIIIISKL